MKEVLSFFVVIVMIVLQLFILSLLLRQEEQLRSLPRVMVEEQVSSDFCFDTNVEGCLQQ